MTTSVTPAGPTTDVVRILANLRQFAGPPPEFWPAYVAAVGALCRAGRGAVLTRPRGGAAGWQFLTPWEGPGPAGPDPALLDSALRLGVAVQPVGGCLALALVVGADQPDVVLVLAGMADAAVTLDRAVTLVRLVADIPAAYQRGREHQQARQDVVRIAEVLDLSGRLHAEQTFRAVALTLCDEIVGRFACSQVSFGWLDGAGYVRLVALSHMKTLDRRMALARALEITMEEAIDQDSEVVWPLPAGRDEIVRAHETYARGHGVAHVVTLPIRWRGELVGALCCERAVMSFAELDVWTLRLCADHTAGWLVTLERNDRGFGRRIADGARALLSALAAPRHFGAKLALVGAVAAVVASLLIPWPYRVEAPFLLKTEDVVTVPAAFDGFIETVAVREGDLVTRGQGLAGLDTRDLLLDQASVLADISRYGREAEKANSTGALADMKIALVRRDQARIELQKIEYQLSNAALVAPIDGVVIEGRLKEVLGAPVKKGDPLLKIGSISNMYAELRVDERDIHEIASDLTGEMAFVGQPEQHFSLRLQAVNPAAEVVEGHNVFLVRAAVTTAPASWWRPGMSGVAKIDIGPRALLWVLTHRTVEFLRMLLWW